jgi:pilus assembly protein Flp/PilA
MLYQPRNEEGQGLVEYALILVLVAVVVIVILALLGPAIGNIFSNIVASTWVAKPEVHAEVRVTS